MRPFARGSRQVYRVYDDEEFLARDAVAAPDAGIAADAVYAADTAVAADAPLTVTETEGAAPALATPRFALPAPRALVALASVLAATLAVCGLVLGHTMGGASGAARAGSSPTTRASVSPPTSASAARDAASNAYAGARGVRPIRRSGPESVDMSSTHFFAGSRRLPARAAEPRAPFAPAAGGGPSAGAPAITSQPAVTTQAQSPARADVAALREFGFER